MTKHEWTVMRDFLEAVKSEVDFDAISSQLGIAANAAEFLLRECEAEGWDPRLPKTADGVTIVIEPDELPLNYSSEEAAEAARKVGSARRSTSSQG